MEIREETVNMDYYWPDIFPDKEKCLFIDIETTGLSVKNASVYMVGLAFYKEGSWTVRQLFAERLFDEQKLLEETGKILGSYDNIITFNGNTFDLPFIAHALKQYGMSGFEVNNSIDLFRKLTAYKQLLGMERCRQVSFEDRLGIPREGDMDGGELIEVYKEFLKNPDAEKKSKLYYHNFSDVKNMIRILEIFKINDILAGSFEYISHELCGDRLFLKVRSSRNLAFTLEYSDENTDILIKGDEISLHIPVQEGRAKLYYSNYKDYYYLPIEDRAIHKSLAVFVETSVREKAKRQTAYSWEPVENCIKSINRFSGSVLNYHIKM